MSQQPPARLATPAGRAGPPGRPQGSTAPARVPRGTPGQAATSGEAGQHDLTEDAVREGFALPVVATQRAWSTAPLRDPQARSQTLSRAAATARAAVGSRALFEVPADDVGGVLWLELSIGHDPDGEPVVTLDLGDTSTLLDTR